MLVCSQTAGRLRRCPCSKPPQAAGLTMNRSLNCTRSNRANKLPVQAVGAQPVAEGGSSAGGNQPPVDTAANRKCAEDDGSDRGFRRMREPLILLVLAAALAWTQTSERRSFISWVENNATKPNAGSVTLVVPVLNEATTLPDLFQHFASLDPPPHEIIFVDGQSTDRTTALIKEQKGMKLVSSGKGRSRQMNAGAAAASGSYLCFVHADSRPCKDVVNVVRFELADPGVALGGFVTRITHEGSIMPWQTTHHFLKTYYMPLILRPRGFFTGLRCLLGDQSLFVRRQDFEASGGFREDLAIMEDADFSIRLHTGDPLSAPTKMSPSACSSRALKSPVSCNPGHRERISSSAEKKHSAHVHSAESALPSLSHGLPPHALAQSTAGSVIDRERDGSFKNVPGSVGSRKHRRRRIRHVLYRSNVTSGRRMAQWGPVKTTFLHFKFGLMWYFGCSAEQLQKAYDELYTDAYR